MSPRLLVPVLGAAGPAGSSLELVEEDWVVPRLVERISDLEDKLYGGQISDAPGPPGGSLWMDKIGAALRAAADGVDASLAYIAGEDAAKDEALHQATASALKITVRKLGALKNAAASLEEELRAAQDDAAAARRRANVAEAELNRVRNELTTEAERAAGLEAALRTAEGAAESAAAEAQAGRAGRAAATQNLHCTRTRLEEAQRLAEDFQRRFLAERLERRRLHEELQALRGNIRVVCRARPLLAAASDSPLALSFPMDAALRVASPVRRGVAADFEFSAVLRPEATQEETFAEVWPALRSCLDGHNVSIIAYGQTGAGKTHTVLGDAQDPGVAPRALEALFDVAAKEADCGECGESRIFSVSMIQVYVDAVQDLLARPQPSKPLEVLGLGPLTPEQLAEGVDRVPGRTWRVVESAAAAAAVLAEGAAARATAATALNAASSRSHLIFSVKIKHSDATSSLLNLVDLAGSERVARSEAEGQQLREAQAINKSLAALGDVVAALQARSPHVPYRNSKLTAVLQDALGRGSKVLLLCCVAPEEEAATETLSTLTFAQRAAAVELGPSSSGGGGGVGGSGEAQKAPKPVSTPSPVLSRPGSRLGSR